MIENMFFFNEMYNCLTNAMSTIISVVNDIPTLNFDPKDMCEASIEYH